MKSASSLKNLATRATGILLCSALLLGEALAQDKGQASRYYEDALVRYEKKDFVGAVIQLKNALKIDNGVLQVHVLLGKSLIANDEFIAAEVALEEASRLGVSRAEIVVPLAKALVGQAKQSKLFADPRFEARELPAGTLFDLLLIKAGASLDLGDVPEALKAVQAARAIDPGSPKSWTSEVAVRSRAGQYADARVAADRALQLQPASSEALYLRGTVSHVQGDLKAALTYYDRALKVQPENLEALVSRAGLLMDLRRNDEVERDVRAIRQLSSHDPRGAFLAALIAERLRKPAEAKAALSDVVNLLDPVPVEFLRYRPQLLMLGGLSHHGLGQFEKAKPYLEAVLRGQPTNPAAKLLAQIHISENNIDRATSLLDDYIRGNPGDTQAAILLASANMSQGRHARATALLRDLVERDDSPQVRGALGSSLLGAGKFAEAVPELLAGWSGGDGQVQAGVTLASLHLQLGQFGQAVKVAEALVKRDPAQPGLQFLLGKTRSRAGDDPGARGPLERALKLDARFSAPQIELARLDMRAGANAQAQARLDAVLAKEQHNKDALSAMAELLVSQRKMDEARRWLVRAEEQSSSSELDPGMRLVTFDLASGRIDLAAESIKRLISKAPEAPRVLVVSARVYLAAGDVVAARTTLTRASGLVAYDVPALVQIAELQVAASHLPGAIHSLDKALAEEPDNVSAMALRAEVDIRRGDLAQAERRARQVLAANPKLSIGHMLVGQVAAARGQMRAAGDSFRLSHQLESSTQSLLRLFAATYEYDPLAALQIGQQWLQKHPRDAAALRAVGDGQARRGDLKSARITYERLLSYHPGDAEAANNLANVLILAKDPSALQVAERAMALQPGAAHIIGTTGWAAFRAGNVDRALQLLRDARLRDPTNANTRYFLATVLAQTGRNAEARQELDAALATGREFSNKAEALRLLATLD